MLSGGETLLGLQRVDPRAPVGFGPPPELGGTGDPITYADDASLITIAATCAGKTSGPVVCNARTYTGQLICLDVKGEAYSTTTSSAGLSL